MKTAVSLSTASDPMSAATLRALVAVVSAGVNVSTNAAELLRVTVVQASSVLGAAATVWLTAAALDGQQARATNHPDAVEADLARVCPLIDTSAGPVLVSASEPRGNFLTRHALAQCAVLPVQFDGRRMGTLAATRATGRPGFSTADLALLTAFADLTATVIEQSRMLADSLSALDDMRRHAEIADYISDALISCDEIGQIVSWNPSATTIYGYEQSEALGCDLFALLATQFSGEDGGEMTRDDVLAMVGSDGRWQGELRERRADGAPLTVDSSINLITDQNGQASGLVVVNRDLTEQRHDEHRALHDPLTGLPNRRMLTTHLFDAFARACRTGSTLAVLFIDLDGFKPINDTYGHAAGDQVLVAIGERLSAVLRGSDVAGRLGGDEFLVILEKAGNTAAVESVARRVAESVAVPIELTDTGHNVTVVVTPSIGVAISEEPDATRTNASILLEAADQAMYEAKRTRCGTAIAPLL